MGLGSLWSYVWWFVLGAFAGSMLWWLIDKLLLRDTETPERLALAEAELEEIQTTNELRLAEIEELQAQARTASARAIEIASLKNDLESRKSRELTYESAYKKVVDEHDAKASQLTDAQSEIERLTKKLAASDVQSVEMKELTRELELARETSANQTRELERLKTEWSAAADHSAGTARLQLDLDARNAQVRSLESEIGTLKGVLIESKNALERQFAEITQLKGDLAAASERGDTELRLETELAASRASEGRLRTELTAATVRIANLERLRLALDAARQAAEGHASEVARLNAEFHASMAAMEAPPDSKS